MNNKKIKEMFLDALLDLQLIVEGNKAKGIREQTKMLFGVLLFGYETEGEMVNQMRMVKKETRQLKREMQ